MAFLNPFTCPLCQKAAATLDAYRCHVNRHRWKYLNSPGTNLPRKVVRMRRAQHWPLHSQLEFCNHVNSSAVQETQHGDVSNRSNYDGTYVPKIEEELDVHESGKDTLPLTIEKELGIAQDKINTLQGMPEIKEGYANIIVNGEETLHLSVKKEPNFAQEELNLTDHTIKFCDSEKQAVSSNDNFEKTQKTFYCERLVKKYNICHQRRNIYAAYCPQKTLPKTSDGHESLEVVSKIANDEGAIVNNDNQSRDKTDWQSLGEGLQDSPSLIYTRSGATQFHCDFCSQNFVRRTDLAIHRLSHTKMDGYQCPECDKSFIYKVHLTDHMMETHDLKELAVSSKKDVGKTQEPIHCDTCGKKYKIFQNYLNHFCQQINYYGRYRQQTALSNVNTKDGHGDEHGGNEYGKTREKKFKCDFCSEAFHSEVSFNSHHAKSHSTLKPYKCQECGKRYIKQHLLQRHVQTRHQVDTKKVELHCEKCQRVFVDESSLNTHLYLTQFGMCNSS